MSRIFGMTAAEISAVGVAARDAEKEASQLGRPAYVAITMSCNQADFSEQFTPEQARLVAQMILDAAAQAEGAGG